MPFSVNHRAAQSGVYQVMIYSCFHGLRALPRTEDFIVIRIIGYLTFLIISNLTSPAGKHIRLIYRHSLSKTGVRDSGRIKGESAVGCMIVVTHYIHD